MDITSRVSTARTPAWSSRRRAAVGHTGTGTESVHPTEARPPARSGRTFSRRRPTWTTACLPGATAGRGPSHDQPWLSGSKAASAAWCSTRACLTVPEGSARQASVMTERSGRPRPTPASTRRAGRWGCLSRRLTPGRAGSGRVRPGQAGDNPQLIGVLDDIAVPTGGRARSQPQVLIAGKADLYACTRTVLRRRHLRTVIPERCDQKARRAARGSRGGRPPASSTSQGPDQTATAMATTNAAMNPAIIQPSTAE